MNINKLYLPLFILLFPVLLFGQWVKPSYIEHAGGPDTILMSNGTSLDGEIGQWIKVAVSDIPIDLTNQTPAQINNLLQSFNFSQLTTQQLTNLITNLNFTELTSAQCQAIADCILGNLTPTQITQLTENINFSQLTTQQITELSEIIDFSQLTTQQYQDIINNLDFTQLTAAQCQAIADCILGNLTPAQVTQLTQIIDYTQLTPLQISELENILNLSSYDDITEGGVDPTVAPAATDPKVYQNTVTGELFTWDGTSWNTLTLTHDFYLNDDSLTLLVNGIAYVVRVDTSKLLTVTNSLVKSEDVKRYVDRRDPFLEFLGPIRTGGPVYFNSTVNTTLDADTMSFTVYDSVLDSMITYSYPPVEMIQFINVFRDGTPTGHPDGELDVVNYGPNNTLTSVPDNDEWVNRLMRNYKTGEWALFQSANTYDTGAETFGKFGSETGWETPVGYEDYVNVSAVQLSEGQTDLLTDNNAGLYMASAFGNFVLGGSSSVGSSTYIPVANATDRDALDPSLLSEGVVVAVMDDDGFGTYCEYRIITAGVDFTSSVKEKIYPPELEDYNTPSCLTSPVGDAVANMVNAGVAGNDNANANPHYVMFTQEPITTRFAGQGVNAGGTEHFVSVLWDNVNSAWKVDNSSTGANSFPTFTPQSTDILVFRYQSNSVTPLVPFAIDGSTNGINHVENYGGLTVTPNMFNGVANSGEMDLTGTFLSFDNSSMLLQLDGTYTNGTTTLTVEEAIVQGYVPCTFDSNTSAADPISTEEGNLIILGDDGEEYALPEVDRECSIYTATATANANLIQNAGADRVESLTSDLSFDITPDGRNILLTRVLVQIFGGSPVTPYDEWMPVLSGGGLNVVGAMNPITSGNLTWNFPEIQLIDGVTYTITFPGSSGGDLRVDTSPINGEVSNTTQLSPGEVPTSIITGFEFTGPFKEVTYSDGETSKTIYVQEGTIDPLETTPTGNKKVIHCLSDEDVTRVVELVTNNSIQSVIGEHVDNTDPLNPIVKTLVKDECYVEQINVALNPNGNTRNSGPSMSGLTVYHIVTPAPPSGGTQATFISGITGVFDGVGNYSVLVTNTTTGESVGSSTETWSGSSTAIVVRAFDLNEPLSVSSGDLISVEAIGTGNGRWRGNFTGTPSGIYTNSSGTGTINSTVDGVFTGYYENFYNVRTYDDNSLYTVDKDGNTVTPISNTSGWTLCPPNSLSEAGIDPVLAAKELISLEEGNLLIKGDDDLLYALPLKSETCYKEIVDAPLAGSLFTLNNYDGNRTVSPPVVLGSSQTFYDPDKQIFFDLDELPEGARIKEVRMYDYRAGNNTAAITHSYNGVNTNAVSAASHANGFSPAFRSWTFTESQLLLDGTPLLINNPSQNTTDQGLGLQSNWISSITPGISTASGGANSGVTSSLEGFNAEVDFELSQINYYTVREYSDGEISKLVYFDSNDDPIVLTDIPTEWILEDCLSSEDELKVQELISEIPKWIKQQCFNVPTTTYQFVGNVVTQNNGNMSQASGAFAPASAPFRFLNPEPVPILMTGFRIRYGANGYSGTGQVTIGGQLFVDGAGFDISGQYRTLPFTPVNNVGVELPVGFNHNSAGGSNHGSLTGGFQGPVITNNPGGVFPTGNVSRAEIDYIVGTPIMEQVIVRTYNDGTLEIVDTVNNITTPLASIPNDWSLCEEVALRTFQLQEFTRTQPVIVGDGERLITIPDDLKIIAWGFSVATESTDTDLTVELKTIDKETGAITSISSGVLLANKNFSSEFSINPTDVDQGDMFFVSVNGTITTSPLGLSAYLRFKE